MGSGKSESFSFDLIVPAKPVAKARPRMTKSGHTYTDKATFQYERPVKILANPERGQREASTEALHVTMRFGFAMPNSWSKKKREERVGTFHRQRPDLDNLVKICDALNNIVWEDDCQVAVISAQKVWSETSFTVISVEPARSGLT